MVIGNAMKKYGYDVTYFLYKGNDIIKEISDVHNLSDFEVIGFSV